MSESDVLREGTKVEAMTEKQRRRYRLTLGVTLYVVGFLTGFGIGAER